MAAKVYFVLLIAAVVLLQSEALNLQPRGLGFRPRPKPFIHPEQLMARRGNYRREMFADVSCVDHAGGEYCTTFADIGYCTNAELYYQPSNLVVFAVEQCPHTCGNC